HGIQVPPAALGCVVFERTFGAASGAGRDLVGGVGEADFDALGREVEVDIIDLPVIIESEQQGVVLSERIHAWRLTCDRAKFQRNGRSAMKIGEEPTKKN